MWPRLRTIGSWSTRHMVKVTKSHVWRQCPTAEDDRDCVSYAEVNEYEEGPHDRFRQKVRVQRVSPFAVIMHTDWLICKSEGLSPTLSVFPASILR